MDVRRCGGAYEQLEMFAKALPQIFGSMIVFGRVMDLFASHFLKNGEKQILFPGAMMIERTSGNMGRVYNFVSTCGVIPFSREQLSGHLDEVLAGFLCLFDPCFWRFTHAYCRCSNWVVDNPYAEVLSMRG
jgi:hypothetical protein